MGRKLKNITYKDLQEANRKRAREYYLKNKEACKKKALERYYKIKSEGKPNE